MEIQSTRARETDDSGANPETHSTPIDPNARERAERALASDRLGAYLSQNDEFTHSAPATTPQVLPVGRFSPSPGLTVDRTGTSVVISGVMELSGPEANAERAASIQRAINTTWTRTFADGYAVQCKIVVRCRAPGSHPAEATQIEAASTRAPSGISYGLHGRTIILNANEDDAFTWAAAHEFGHIIGLKDRYSEAIMSRIRGFFGGWRATPADPGYRGNIMAETGGTVTRQNVVDIAAENDPSPYWIHDDGQVSAWVSAHSPAEIGALSTADKLRAIQTLQGGWISSQDMEAIGRICGSVTSKTEADAIRRGVDLLTFTDLGQRTQMRVFLAKMP